MQHMQTASNVVSSAYYSSTQLNSILHVPPYRCGPCRQVFPHLTSIFEARKDKGLVVVGISIEDDPTLDSFVQKEGSRMGYTVAVDTQGGTQRLMQEAGVSGIPHAFVCDREGRIAHRWAMRSQS